MHGSHCSTDAVESKLKVRVSVAGVRDEVHVAVVEPPVHHPDVVLQTLGHGCAGSAADGRSTTTPPAATTASSQRGSSGIVASSGTTTSGTVGRVDHAQSVVVDQVEVESGLTG